MEMYFIALIPESDLKKEIRALKEEVKERFDVKHALKLPAHVTLQPPFKKPEEEESALINTLESFSKELKPFEIHLNGFGNFRPRAIFVNVENPLPVVRLHSGLQQALKPILKADERDKSSTIHPHMTIATRDLDRKDFNKVWSEFKNRDFKAGFYVNSLFLLKHNGKTWDLHREFSFGE